MIVLNNGFEILAYNLLVVAFYEYGGRLYDLVGRKIKELRNRKKIVCTYNMELGMKPKIKELNVVYNGRLLKRGTDYKLTKGKTIMFKKI